jgi:hypothetical protein
MSVYAKAHRERNAKYQRDRRARIKALMLKILKKAA